MARADLLTHLVKFGITGDKARFCKVVEAIIAEERIKQHKVLAEKLESLLHNSTIDRFINNGLPIFKKGTEKGKRGRVHFIALLNAA